MFKTEGVPLESAWSTACSEAAALGVDPQTLPDARRAVLRLERRLPALLALISDCGATFESLRHEQELSSADGRLVGHLDLLILGKTTSVVDYKTGIILDDGVPLNRYARQLAIYAWLVESVLDLDVAESALFSLSDGVIKVDTSHPVRTAIIAEILEAQNAFNARVPGPQPAQPSVEGCQFCPFIGDCDDAWNAYHNGALDKLGVGAAVSASVVSEIVVASNGLSAIPIQFSQGTDTAEGLISDVPSNASARLAVGSRFRCWGLGVRSQQPTRLSWRAGTSRLVLLD